MLHRERPYHDGTFENWAEKPSHQFPFHYSDGVTIYLAKTDENPEDDFLGDAVSEDVPVDGDPAREG